MGDRSLGSLIFILGFVGAVVYLYWLFAPANPNDLLFFCVWANARWALVLPIVIIVLVVLTIAMWFGWTMASIPPPIVLEEKMGENKQN